MIKKCLTNVRARYQKVLITFYLFYIFLSVFLKFKLFHITCFVRFKNYVICCFYFCFNGEFNQAKSKFSDRSMGRETWNYDRRTDRQIDGFIPIYKNKQKIGYVTFLKHQVLIHNYKTGIMDTVFFSNMLDLNQINNLEKIMSTKTIGKWFWKLLCK